jgi:hypothetical protein
VNHLAVASLVTISLVGGSCVWAWAYTNPQYAEAVSGDMRPQPSLPSAGSASRAALAGAPSLPPDQMTLPPGIAAHGRLNIVNIASHHVISCEWEIQDDRISLTNVRYDDRSFPDVAIPISKHGLVTDGIDHEYTNGVRYIILMGQLMMGQTIERGRVFKVLGQDLKADIVAKEGLVSAIMTPMGDNVPLGLIFETKGGELHRALIRYLDDDVTILFSPVDPTKDTVRLQGSAP